MPLCDWCDERPDYHICLECGMGLCEDCAIYQYGSYYDPTCAALQRSDAALGNNQTDDEEDEGE